MGYVHRMARTEFDPPAVARIAAIRQRAQAATKGPWSEGAIGNGSVYGPDSAGDDSGLIARVYKGRANVTFIAEAREDIPYLLAEVDRIATERDRQETHIRVLNSVLAEHGEFGGWFQPGGKYHKVADLRLGASAVVEGGKWLDERLTALTEENAALRDNNAAMKASWDEARQALARLRPHPPEEKEMNHRFIGGYTVDPTQPATCQVCGRHVSEHQQRPRVRTIAEIETDMGPAGQ